MQPITVAGWSRVLPEAGAGRLRTAMRDARDRLVASDPGLGRLRQALKAVLAVATTVLVELVYARVLGRSSDPGRADRGDRGHARLHLVSEPSRTKTLRTMAGVPVAASVGATLGVATVRAAPARPGHLRPGLLRRGLGPPVRPTVVHLRLPGLAGLLLRPVPAPAAGGAAVPGRCHRGRVSVGRAAAADCPARQPAACGCGAPSMRCAPVSRAGISAMLEVLEDPDADAPRRRLRAQLVQLSEIALLMDGQLGDPRAVPAGLRRGQVRRWAVDIEIAMDEAAAAVLDLARHKDQLPAQLLGDIRRLLRSLGWGVSEQAHQWVATLEQETTVAGSRGTTARVGRRRPAALGGAVEHRRAGRPGREPCRPRRPARRDRSRAAFEPVITLFAGNLPGSAAVASSVVEDSEGRSWWSPSRLRLTTRQAVQAALAAALAIVAGEAISPQRYYWAVIAAFIAFTGASNTGETFQRSVARVAGTHGRTGRRDRSGARDHGPPRSRRSPGLFACIFLAFYVQQLSYAAMIFFITLMLGQMYTLLNTFTDAVLVLRLEETAAGAAIGVAVLHRWSCRPGRERPPGRPARASCTSWPTCSTGAPTTCGWTRAPTCWP